MDLFFCVADTFPYEAVVLILLCVIFVINITHNFYHRYMYACY